MKVQLVPPQGEPVKSVSNPFKVNIVTVAFGADVIKPLPQPALLLTGKPKAPINMLVNLEQAKKQLPPIEVTLFGISILVNLEQPWKQ
jgi:hypothetical protein